MLALNCGFSKAEIATLRLDEVVESGKYTFIKRSRRKTGAYGEWILWPETLAALGYLARFRGPGEAHAVVNRAGRGWIRVELRVTRTRSSRTTGTGSAADSSRSIRDTSGSLSSTSARPGRQCYGT